MIIKPDNDKLVYSGRIDWSNTEAPVFVFPCTSVKMKFSGKKVKIQIRNRNAYWNNYIGCILDGKQTVLPLPEQGEATVEFQQIYQVSMRFFYSRDRIPAMN